MRRRLRRSTTSSPGRWLPERRRISQRPRALPAAVPGRGYCGVAIVDFRSSTRSRSTLDLLLERFAIDSHAFQNSCRWTIESFRPTCGLRRDCRPVFRFRGSLCRWRRNRPAWRPTCRSARKHRARAARMPAFRNTSLDGILGVPDDDEIVAVALKRLQPVRAQSFSRTRTGPNRRRGSCGPFRFPRGREPAYSRPPLWPRRRFSRRVRRYRARARSRSRRLCSS